jgi:sigma-70-like protein
LSNPFKNHPKGLVQVGDREMLGNAILSLQSRERLIFTLYYYEGLTTAQLELLLDEAESSVSQTHASALAHIKIRLAELHQKTPVTTSGDLPFVSDNIEGATGHRLSLRPWSQEGPSREIRIRLWRNLDAQDWSVEINGLRHEHLSSEILEDLVEAALIVGEEQLMKFATRRQ